MEKALNLFSSVHEWADFISFLSKLAKTLTHYDYPTVPCRLVLCKRLAQCLNPNLPPGVHLKTLEIYELIFSRISVHFYLTLERRPN